MSVVTRGQQEIQVTTESGKEITFGWFGGKVFIELDVPNGDYATAWDINPEDAKVIAALLNED